MKKCKYVKTYFHQSGPLKLSYVCMNPACNEFSKHTDPIFCALCPDKKEETDHGPKE